MRSSVGEMFAVATEQLLSEDPEVEQGRMFRAGGLKTRGKFFALVVDGELVVKLPAERVDELVAAGAHRFEAGGRSVREWVRLQPADEAACRATVSEARDFVARGGGIT